MLPTSTVDYINRVSKYYEDQRKEEITNHESRIRMLDANTKLARDKLLLATQDYLSKGYADFRPNSKCWGTLPKPDNPGGKSYEPLTNYLKQLSHELGRGWITVSAGIIRVPAQKKYFPLWAPLSVAAQPYAPPQWVRNSDGSWGDNRPACMVKNYTTFREFIFAGPADEMLKQTLLRWETDEQCRKVLRTGEYQLPVTPRVKTPKQPDPARLAA